MRQTKVYPEELRQALVQKICSPNSPGVSQISKESGIACSTLYAWVAKMGKSNKSTKAKPTTTHTPEQKFQIILESSALAEPELGEYLRKNGLHSKQIAEWKQEALAAMTTASEVRKPGRPRKDPELVAAESEIKELKRDLRRKEKALAEQTALVILQKKVQAIWGTDEDDE